jgi:hypothetical protein
LKKKKNRQNLLNLEGLPIRVQTSRYGVVQPLSRAKTLD